MRRGGTAEQHHHRFRCEQYLLVQIVIQVGLRSLGRRPVRTMVMALVCTSIRGRFVFVFVKVVVIKSANGKSRLIVTVRR